MKTKLVFQFKLVAILFSILTVAGCSYFGPTKPNEPYTGPYPDKFGQFAIENPLLAKEIGKLPELQDGISGPERTALDELCDLYAENASTFNKAFNEMNRIGKPEVRKYCSPLQALFWLLIDKKMDDARKIVQSYSLTALLEKAWVFSSRYEEPLFMTKEQIDLVIERINNKNIQNSYNNMVKNDELLRVQNLILSNYDHNRRIFSWNAVHLIENVLNNRPKNRWGNFYQVADRINSPELFDFWVSRYIKYGDYDVRYTKTAKATFNDKSGDCSDVAELGQTILNRAGYDVKKICTINHVMGSIKKDGLYWVIIDFTIDYTKFGNNPHGPYKRLAEIPNLLPRCHPRVEP